MIKTGNSVTRGLTEIPEGVIEKSGTIFLTVYFVYISC